MGKVRRILQDLKLRRQIRFWRKVSKTADSLPGDQRHKLLVAAKKLKPLLEQLEQAATRTQNPQNNSEPLHDLPANTLWASRPYVWENIVVPNRVVPVQSGQKIGTDVTIFHDCKFSEISFIQKKSKPKPNGPSHIVAVDILNFGGSYLSLALALPEAVINEVTRNDLVRLDLEIHTEAPLVALGRLNLKVGPNVEQINRLIDFRHRKVSLEFDLFYVEQEQQKISDLWVDLIFENPAMNLITIGDLRISRRPRAKN